MSLNSMKGKAKDFTVRFPLTSSTVRVIENFLREEREEREEALSMLSSRLPETIRLRPFIDVVVKENGGGYIESAFSDFVAIWSRLIVPEDEVEFFVNKNEAG